MAARPRGARGGRGQRAWPGRRRHRLRRGRRAHRQPLGPGGVDLHRRAELAPGERARARAHPPGQACGRAALGRGRRRRDRGGRPDHRGRQAPVGDGPVAEHEWRPHLAPAEPARDARRDHQAGRPGHERQHVPRRPPGPRRGGAQGRGCLPVGAGLTVELRGQAGTGSAHVDASHRRGRERPRVRGGRCHPLGPDGVPQQARPRLAPLCRPGQRGRRAHRWPGWQRRGCRERARRRRRCGGHPAAPAPRRRKRATAGRAVGADRGRHPGHHDQRPGRGRPSAGRRRCGRWSARRVAGFRKRPVGARWPPAAGVVAERCAAERGARRFGLADRRPGRDAGAVPAGDLDVGQRHVLDHGAGHRAADGTGSQPRRGGGRSRRVRGGGQCPGRRRAGAGRLGSRRT